MTDDPITRREADALTRALRDLTTGVEKLREDMDATYVRKDVLEPKLDTINSTLKSHGDWLTWAQRIVLGAVLIALVALVISQGGDPR